MRAQFLNHATIIGIFFIIVQQSIVASSTALIALLSQSVMEGYGYMLWLILFVVSLSIVYIPTMLTNYFFNKSKYITYGKYVLNFSEQAYNHPNCYFNSRFREEKESYFTHEAWLIIQEVNQFIMDILSVFLNVFLNVVVLSIFLDWSFLVAYIFAIPLSLACILASKSRLQKKSDEMQQSRNDMMQSLINGWDTILIGNTWNMRLWKDKFINRWNIADKAQRKLTLEIDAMSLITLVVSALPILTVLFMSFIRAQGDLVMLAMLVATAPRQVLTIQYLSDIIGLFVNLNDKVHRTRQLSRNLIFDESFSDIGGKIAWGNIYIEVAGRKTALYNYDELNSLTKKFSKGRYTITGDNGTGKTTLLTKIKVTLQDGAYLLPSQSKMTFLNENKHKEYSTGEKTLENLREISLNACDGRVSVLLLDEWNANLDKDNIKRINLEIDRLSNSICVIEVLHKT